MFDGTGKQKLEGSYFMIDGTGAEKLDGRYFMLDGTGTQKPEGSYFMIDGTAVQGCCDHRRILRCLWLTALSQKLSLIHI